MKFILISIIAFIYINANSQTISFGGHINTNTTWSADTVKIIDDVIIDNQATLSIEAGTYIEFMAHYMIYVQGSINANGTIDDTITFTSADTSGFNNELDTAGSWFGFKFINTDATNDSSKLTYCKIQYVKDLPEQDSIQPGGAIVIEHFSKLTIEKCIIRNNKAENDYSYIGNGGAITMFENSNPIIQNNIFYNNFASANGGAIYCEKSNPKIISNIFYNNIAGDNSAGSGGALKLSFCDGNYTNDTIVSLISNNLIYNNHSYEGGGINSHCSSANFLNNTICNNSSSYGGGLYSRKAHPMFINTILYNNTAIEGYQIYINHDASVCTPGNDPHFKNCDIEYGIDSIIIRNDQLFHGYFYNNLDTVPLFINETANNYKLQSFSPLINKGKSDSLDFEIPQYDLAGNIRILNDTIDIGAYENQNLTKINYINNNENVIIYPNPSSRYITVKTNDINKISIYNSIGKLVKVINSPNNNLSIDLNNFTRGIYFVKIYTNHSITTTKLILE